MTEIALVVIISLLEGVTAPIGSLDYEEASWSDYINKQVELDDYDKDKARTAEDDTEEVAKEMTAHYDQPKAFRKESSGIAPFVSLLYTEDIIKTDQGGKKTWSIEPDAIIGKACGGTALTRNVVMTICACVHTFLYRYDQIQNPKSTLPKDTTGPHKPAEYDLGHKNIYVLPFTENVFDHQPRLKTYYDTLFQKYIIGLNPARKYAQYHNSACVKLISLVDKHKWDKLVNKTTDNLHEEMTRTLVILKYSPDFDQRVPDWYVPWPPVVIPYDTVKPGSKHMNGLNYGRNIQSITVFSFAFRQWLNTTEYKNDDGTSVDVFHSLIAFRASMCDQDNCMIHLLLDSLLSEDKEIKTNYESLGCFCDSTIDNKNPNINTVCGGIIGSPAMYEGELYGLIAETVPCANKAPRTISIRAFTDKMVLNFQNAVPDLAMHVNDPDERIKFRANSSQIMEYNIFLPAPETMPDIDAELKDRPYEREDFYRPHKGCSSTIPIPFILTVFIQISIELLAN